jgi:hypothetical protein
LEVPCSLGTGFPHPLLNTWQTQKRAAAMADGEEKADYVAKLKELRTIR